METDPGRKTAQVNKILNSLDKFLNGYSDDGGCDEGPSYWGAAGALLYECLEIMKDVTDGKFDVFDDPLIQNMGNYFYKVNIHAPYFINFADAEAEEALVAGFWFPDTEVAGARDREGSISGFFFGAKGGFNAESHNHNDIGSCLMYFDGKPCLIDLGREEYVAKTFSSRRYEIWTMQSGYHNLPVINGTDQKDGEAFKARNSSFTSNARSADFTTDIAGAYPEGAKVLSWIRTYTLNRGRNFVISDKYELKEVTGAPTSSNLMTYCKVTQVKPGLLKFEGDGFTLNMTYNQRVLTPEIEYIEITDRTLKRYWPNGVTRVRMKVNNPGLKGSISMVFTKG